MKKILELLEYGFAIAVLILSTGAILSLLVTGGYSQGEADEFIPDNTLIKQIFLVFYIITAILLGCRWKQTVYVASKNPLLLLFTGLALTSIIWSEAPDITLPRSIALLGTNLFALYLASRYTLQQQVLLLTRSFGTILVLSLLFAILLPKYGIMSGDHMGAWRGVFTHKNALGKWMVISTVIFFLQSISDPPRNVKSYLGLMGSIGLAIASRSSSTLVNLLLVIVVFLTLKTWRWRYEVMIPASIAIILLTSSFWIWFNSNSSILFASLGKDSSLTGRTVLWPLVWDMALKKIWQGYSYGSFWDRPNGPATDIWRTIGWSAPNAHNGYLDLFIGLGLVGIVILALSFIDTLIRSFICLRYSKTSAEFWPLIFMSYFIVSNLTESGLMVQNDLFTIAYMTISYSVIINTNARARAIVFGSS
jgi:exopolysaccharide production protein ExoQ